jgi:hypothetical protein
MSPLSVFYKGALIQRQTLGAFKVKTTRSHLAEPHYTECTYAIKKEKRKKKREKKIDSIFLF